MRGVQALRSRLETSFARRCIVSFVGVQGIDRAMVIASQAFTALIPLLIVVSAVAPRADRDLVSDVIIRRLALSGSAADAVRQLFAHPDEATTGVLSVLLLLFSGLSLTRRMQRLYLQAWRLEARTGVRGTLSAAFGLAALLIEVVLLSLVASLVGRLPFDRAVGPVLSAVASLVVWTSIPWLLLDRRVSWRRLLPTGALAGTCGALYGFATTIYIPRLMETYSQRYGLFGVTLALVGWLLGIGLIVVATTVVAAEFDRAPDPWARRLRARFRLETPADE